MNILVLLDQFKKAVTDRDVFCAMRYGGQILVWVADTFHPDHPQPVFALQEGEGIEDLLARIDEFKSYLPESGVMMADNRAMPWVVIVTAILEILKQLSK